jgi:hypothetical protein
LINVSGLRANAEESERKRKIITDAIVMANIKKVRIKPQKNDEI